MQITDRSPPRSQAVQTTPPANQQLYLWKGFVWIKPASAWLPSVSSDGSSWQKGKNSNKNFKEIADLLFITKGLTWWLFNLTARTFDDNQQFNFFLNLDFFFSLFCVKHQSQLKIAKRWMLEGRIVPITAFFFFYNVKLKVKTKLIRWGYL